MNKKDEKKKIDEATQKDEPTGIDLENKKHIEVLAQQFTIENRDLFEMVGRRLIDYAQSGNALYINWMSQSLIRLLKQANRSCKKRLGIATEIMQ